MLIFPDVLYLMDVISITFCLYETIVKSTVTYLCQTRYHQAKMSVQDRAAKISAVVESLERDMTLLCLTGVEDKLQECVRPTLELLRNAGIKVLFFLTFLDNLLVQGQGCPLS